MKANELMIGDWVSYQGNNNRVYRILPATVPFADIGRAAEDLLHIVWNSGRNDVHNQVNVQDVEPIPLTPEILEKNGWMKFQTYYRFGVDEEQYLEYYPHEGRLQRLYIHKDNSREVVFTVSGISYVHIMQHALRLCGIDKEISAFEKTGAYYDIGYNPQMVTNGSSN